MKNSKKRNVYKNFFIYLIAILISTDLLFINLRIGFSKEIVKFVNNIHFMLIISIITFYVCTQIKKAKTIFSFLLIILLFAIPFAYYWSTGITTQKILGGLIPHRDSMYYYLEARNSLNGKLTSSMTAGRPIFSGFLAPLIALTQNNIQAVLVILALLCAISFYFIFYEAQVEFSPLPASLLMAGVYNFYARYIPHLVSEQLGMILSLTGWTLLLIGIRRENRKFLLLGILIMSIAFNARSGAMFVLPTLVVFTGFAFKKKRFSATDFGLAAAAVLLGFLINRLVFQLLVDPEKMPFASFAFAIYGQSKGGAGWTSHQKDFPGLTNTYEILRLALMNIKRYPLGLAIGSFKAFRDFFTPGGIDNAFVFITGHENGIITYLIWASAWFLCGYELVHSVRKIKKPLHLFEVLVFAGILFSIPFAPPRDSSSMRTYAVTVPFMMLLPAAGLRRLLKKTAITEKIKNHKPHTSNPRFLLAFSIILIAVIILSPIMIKFLAKPATYKNNECTERQIPATFDLSQGSYITLIPDDIAPCAGTPDVCYSTFINNSRGGLNELYEVVLETTRTSKEEVVFSAINDLNTGEYYYILLNKKELPLFDSDSQAISVCLTEIDKGEFLYSATNLKSANFIDS